MTPHRLPLSQHTDLAVLRLLGASIDDYGTHLVARTPSLPTFHFGNLIVIVDESSVNDVEGWLERFVEALPEAKHRAFLLPCEPDSDAWAAHGLEAGAEVALVRAPHTAASETPAGYELSLLPETQDWVDLLPDGPNVDLPHLEFRGQQLAAQRRLAHAGPAAWFGAKHDGRVVASLGIVDIGDGLARYQAVMTNEEHRGRGLASWLLSVAGHWAHQRGIEQLVIVADADSAAVRLYETNGFTPIVTSWGISADQVALAAAASSTRSDGPRVAI